MTGAHSNSSTATMGADSPLTLALSASAFLVVTYILCVAGVLVLPPGGVVHRLLLIVPGFAWSAPGIARGLVAVVLAGAYVGLVFGLIHRFIVRRRGVVTRGNAAS